MLNQQQFASIIALQRQLDQKIMVQHNVKDEDTLTARFLALLVELGEFANEQRCFKYWSAKASSAKAIMLEEYIDSLHFIISIGNTLNINIQNFIFIAKVNYENLSLAFIEMFAIVTTLFKTNSQSDFYELLSIYFSIAIICHFSAQEIMASYMHKNKINHLRQSQNY